MAYHYEVKLVLGSSAPMTTQEVTEFLKAMIGENEPPQEAMELVEEAVGVPCQLVTLVDVVEVSGLPPV